MKIQEEKLLESTKELEFLKKKENDIQNEVIDLKQEVEMSNKTIDNLQEEVKANYSLVPELQVKISVSLCKLYFKKIKHFYSG